MAHEADLQSGKYFEVCSEHCRLLADFIDRSVRPILDRQQKVLPYARICDALLVRVQAWLNSVNTLQSPGDLQALSAASRAVFETAIDMVLIQHHENQSVKKLMTWERSSKLKYAERHAAHSADPDMLNFIAEQGPSILSECATTWGVQKNKKPRRPERWTGRTLKDDAALAERYVSTGFVKFYAELYGPACWYIHGSGVVGLLEVPLSFFPTLGAIALHNVCRFGQICAEYALRLLNEYDEICENRFEQFRQELGEGAIAALSQSSTE